MANKKYDDTIIGTTAFAVGFGILTAAYLFIVGNPLNHPFYSNFGPTGVGVMFWILVVAWTAFAAFTSANIVEFLLDKSRETKELRGSAKLDGVYEIPAQKFPWKMIFVSVLICGIVNLDKIISFATTHFNYK